MILWKQSHVLVHKKGFPARFETVVKDLWALKLQRLQNRIGAIDNVQGDTQLFSSQAESTETENTGARKAKYSRQFPKLIDTLSLCYLAAVLLRLPISIGDLHRHAVFLSTFLNYNTDSKAQMGSLGRDSLHAGHTLNPRDHKIQVTSRIHASPGPDGRSIVYFLSVLKLRIVSYLFTLVIFMTLFVRNLKLISVTLG